MAKASKKEQMKAVQGALALAQDMRLLSSNRLWVDLDEEADVLYISLRRPQKATNTIEVEDKGVLLRYRERELVGITVLDARKRR